MIVLVLSCNFIDVFLSMGTNLVICYSEQSGAVCLNHHMKKIVDLNNTKSDTIAIYI
jgi:hypothetical protein